MYKVLLVDDELAIRKGLRSIVDWAKYGFEVAEEASNGRDGLEKAKLLLPDLIVADVRMPGMNGLEMLREVRTCGQDAHFILLTGFSEFEYAKQAIHLGVANYLLKPVNPVELEESLITIRMSLNKREERRLIEETAWFYEEAAATIATASNADPRFLQQLDMPWRSYQIVLAETMDEGNERERKERAAAQLRQYISLHRLGAVFAQEGYIGLALKDVTVEDEIHGAGLTDIFAEHKLIFSAGPVVHAHDVIHTSYEEAKKKFKYAFYFLDDRTGALAAPAEVLSLGYEETLDAPVPDSSESLEERMQKVLLHAEAGNRYLMETWLDHTARLMYQGRMEESQIKAWYAELINKAKQMGLYGTEGDGGGVQGTEIYKHRSFIGLHRLVKASLADSFMGQEGRNEQALPRLLDIIHNRYHEPLRLEALAELFHYNSNYLGKMFKKHTGEGFNSYLDKVRISHAKKLLKQGHKVHQVARDVGYPNVDYFHAKFKRYVGISPSSYKQSDFT